MGKSKAVFRPMADIEARAALALGSCSFSPGSTVKRIARTLSNQVPSKRITDKQASLLWRLVWSYRRQVQDAELLEIARQKRIGVPSEAPQGELPW